MYLQITTKCNMHCLHCCYSCTMKGKHGELSTICDAIAFARDRDDEFISIGGGEPTLHPDFFRILSYALDSFNSVWMATNGSQMKAMYRLSNIIDDEDYLSFDDHCTCKTEEEIDGCTCLDNLPIISQIGKLSVALSRDRYHDPIDKCIVDLWTRKAHVHRHSHYEIRDVGLSVANTGRAKRTGVGSSNHCVCPDIFIRPDGKIKLCGCTRSPIIGDVWAGIEDEWEDIINNHDGFSDTRCYKSIK